MTEFFAAFYIFSHLLFTVLVSNEWQGVSANEDIHRANYLTTLMSLAIFGVILCWVDFYQGGW